MTWVDLIPNALWHEILRFVTAQDLVRMEQVCWKFNIHHNPKDHNHVDREPMVSINDLWKTHCRIRWNDKPRYKLTKDREAWLYQHYNNEHSSITVLELDGDSAATQGADNNTTTNSNATTSWMSSSDGSRVGRTKKAPLAIPSTSSSSSTSLTPFFSWKKAYCWMEQDLARTALTYDELESLGWYFNFSPIGGGRGKDSLVRCIFRDGLVFVTGFRPFPYRLLFLQPNDNPDTFSEDANDHSDITDTTGYYPNIQSGNGSPTGTDTSHRHNQKQAILIADFPLHYISRLHDSGEWLMINPYVTFVSTDEAGTLTYKERNFQ